MDFSRDHRPATRSQQTSEERMIDKQARITFWLQNKSAQLLVYRDYGDGSNHSAMQTKTPVQVQ